MGNGTRGVTIRATLILTGLAAFGVASCGGEDAPTEPAGGSVVSEGLLADTDLAGRLDELTQALGLSDEQLEAIQEVAARHGDRENEPGAAWYVAAELQAILSSDQVSELDGLQAAARARSRMERGARSATGDSARDRQGTGARSFGRTPGGGNGFAWLDLTEEQATQVEAVLESHRAEMQALREQLRSGDLSPEEMRSKAEAVREAIRAEIEPLLTQEQRARLEERQTGLERDRESAAERREVARQRGEAQHAAMVDALGLTEAQIDQLADLRQDRGAHREAFAEILTDEQLEVVTVHRALVAHRFHSGRRGGHDRGAGRRGGGSAGELNGARVQARARS
jgi:Spy/CpxP family protein refolding chaperone